ncbi:MAG TPA: hypothetical protein EYH45_04010 [Candidatus Caldiarchaeum subterraneum]|uniref:Uncharacterized protein n=1 Tax=Caldiarchaeum subterraneum TaxID=311458 RepID=A0A832ZVN7_CALS0|nr:hypothetical protein [Candidatus Caldarchaeum subterraneum]
MAAFQIGKASKPSVTKQNLKEIQKNLTQLRYSIHVIDSERIVDDIPLSMFDELLSISEELGGYAAPVLTIPVRRSDFAERLKECIEVLKRHKLGGVCIVAGNPAYLNEDEKNRPADRLLIKAAEAVGKEAIYDGKLLMVGTENIERTAAYIAAKYRAIPFTLLDEARRGEVRRFSSAGRPVAVYVPYHIGNPLPEEALNRARAYALRRLGNAGGEVEVAAKMCQVTVLGDVEKIRRRLMRIAEEGASLVVGYPLEEGLEQVRRLAEAVLHM